MFVTFHVSHTWLESPVWYHEDREHLHHCRKFYWAAHCSRLPEMGQALSELSFYIYVTFHFAPFYRWQKEAHRSHALTSQTCMWQSELAPGLHSRECWNPPGCQGWTLGDRGERWHSLALLHPPPPPRLPPPACSSSRRLSRTRCWHSPQTPMLKSSPSTGQ